jgi:RNA polymerase sigma-70 factor (TIGR02943 family)
MSFQTEVADLRSYLLRYARLQLRNEAWAEDAVSETLLAALSKPQSFAQRSQLKTWLVGILKHKLVDSLRSRRREVCLPDGEGDGGDELDALTFKADGHFVTPPADWGDPERALASRQFFEVLEVCAEKLPPAMARVFMMREWLDMDSDDICQELGLSATNLYVQLHRARLRLRECLELRWFAAPPHP